MLDLLLLNARVPEERRGDYFAQVAACRLGVRRVGEMIARPRRADARRGVRRDHPPHRASACSRRSTRIPPGEYTLRGRDGRRRRRHHQHPDPSARHRAAARQQRKVLFDFTGTGPQVKGNINSTVTVTLAGVLYSLKALLDPDVPNNQGLIEIVDIIAPLGTLINSRFPAAVAARANTAQRIVDVVIGALAPAIPEAAVGAANGANTTAVFFGHDPRHDRHYVYLETLGGGFGGRFSKDGKDGVQVHITNTSNLPVESIEMEYPLLVESYGLVAGFGRRRTSIAAGSGCAAWCGRSATRMTFSGQGERFVNRPWGLFGGASGGTGKFVKLTGDARGRRCRPSPRTSK